MIRSCAVQSEYIPAIDLRSKVQDPRKGSKRKVILPAKFNVMLYLGTQASTGTRKVHYRRIGKYNITALTPAGVHYVPKALREWIKALDCAQLVPADGDGEVKEKGKAA